MAETCPATDIKELYFEYLAKRRQERLTGEPNGRIKIKADLARAISEGNGNWYFQRLNHQVPVYNQTYGAIAAAISDGNFVRERREPSLAESVLATQEINQEYQKVKEILLPNVRCLIKIGSTSWAENFDVRMDPCEPSDLDLEAIIDYPDPAIARNLPEGENQMRMFQREYDAGNADYFSFSYKSGQRPISIHFMISEKFLANCNQDYTKLDHYLLANEFRTKPKSKPPVYDERYDGLGREYIYHSTVRLLPDGGQITQTPIMMVGDDEKLVMGLVMSKYFTYPSIEGDQFFFESNIKTFKQSVAQRLEMDGGGLFSNMPARKNRMPYYILDRLNEEQICIQKNF